MSSSGSSFQDLLSSLGRGLIGAPNFGVGLAQGFANFQQQNDYNNLLSKLTQPGSPGNPVGTGTPTNNFVTADRSGMQPITQPKPAGLLAGTNPGILSLLGSMRPDQGLPLLNTLLTNAVTPHGFKIADTADGPHKLDAITGDDLGRVGPAKLQEFNPTMTYARPDDNTATGGMPPALLVPPKAAPSGNVPRAEDIAPALQKVFPGIVITGMGRTPAQNAAVGGANNSDHLGDHALDIRPIKGVPFADFKAKVMQLGLPGLQVLDETAPGTPHSTGPHWHIGWNEARAGGTQPTQASSQPDQSPFPGYTVVHQAGPVERYVTADSPEGRANGNQPGWLKVDGSFRPDTMPHYSPDELTGMAQAVLQQGPSALMGRDQATAHAVNGVLYGAASQGGLRPDNVDAKTWGNWVVNARIGTKARQQAGDFLAKQQANTQVAESTVVNSMNILRRLLPKLPQGGITDINSLLLSARQHLNSADAANVANAISSIQNEFARVLTGQTNGAGSSDAARAHAASFILQGYSGGTMDAVMRQMVQEMEGRTHSQLAGLQTLLGNAPTGTGYGGVQPTTQYGNAPVGSPQQPAAPNVIRYDANGNRIK